MINASFGGESVGASVEVRLDISWDRIAEQEVCGLFLCGTEDRADSRTDSHAHVKANASFSICACLCSAGVRALDL